MRQKFQLKAFITGVGRSKLERFLFALKNIFKISFFDKKSNRLSFKYDAFFC